MEPELIDGEYYILLIGPDGRFIAHWREDKKSFQIPGNWNDTKIENCKKIIPLSLAIQAEELQAENERLQSLNEQLLAAAKHGRRIISDIQAFRTGICGDHTVYANGQFSKFRIDKYSDIIDKAIKAAEVQNELD